MDHWPDRGGVIARVTEHMLICGSLEALQELVSDAFLHKQPRAGEAHLTGVVILPGRLARRRIDVGILENEERALAAQLARERHEVLGCRDADVTRRLG